eukprot:g3058.t1
MFITCMRSISMVTISIITNLASVGRNVELTFAGCDLSTCGLPALRSLGLPTGGPAQGEGLAQSLQRAGGSLVITFERAWACPRSFRCLRLRLMLACCPQLQELAIPALPRVQELLLTVEDCGSLTRLTLRELGRGCSFLMLHVTNCPMLRDLDILAPVPVDSANVVVGPCEELKLSTEWKSSSRLALLDLSERLSGRQGTPSLSQGGDSSGVRALPRPSDGRGRPKGPKRQKTQQT